MVRKLVAISAAGAALAVVGAGVADSAGPGHDAPSLVTRVAVKPTAVSADLAGMFDALAQSPEPAVPNNVRAFAETDLVRERFAPNPALARAVRPPAREGGPDWHLLPADGGVCLFVAAAGTCTPADKAATEGAWIVRFPKPAGKAAPGQVPGVGPHTLMGVLPAGVKSIVALTDTGDEVAAATSGDAYSVDITRGYVRTLRFTREDGSTYIGRLGR
jgi:hypothetical protein